MKFFITFLCNHRISIRFTQRNALETAENALLLFSNGTPAYLTKRFDVKTDGSKWAQEDFASLAAKTPQTQGEHYKYTGNYLDLFVLMRKYLPAYQIEAPKLFKVWMVNYLFSNGDAHLKNFSLLETPFGDNRHSPACDLLNSRIPIEDSDFALHEGLLPGSLEQGSIKHQFSMLAEQAGLNINQVVGFFNLFTSNSLKVEKLIKASFLDEKMKAS